MNRIGLKNASKHCIRDSQSGPFLVTLLYFVIQWAVNGLSSLITGGSIFDYITLLSDPPADLMDLFRSGFLGAAGARTSLSGLVGLICSLILTVFMAGYSLYCLRLSRGAAKGVGDVAEPLAYGGKVIWLSILIGFFTFVWSLLFIIPGIVAAYRYRMAYFALVNDPSLTAREALNVSKQITRGHKLELFVLDLSFIGWHILCGLTLGILYIWKLPYIQTTYAHAFNWMLDLDGGAGASYRGPEIL